MSSNAKAERRTLSPSLVVTIIGQLWPTIDQLKKTNQTVTMDKLEVHMFKNYKTSFKTSFDCQKLVSEAVKDRLIVANKSNDKNGDQIDVYSIPEEADDGHDWYCFECHRPGSVLECGRCWRVFHYYCVKRNDSEDSYICQICRALEQQEEGVIGRKQVPITELNQLLGYVYKRLVAHKQLQPMVHIKDQRYLNRFLYHKMDLSDIETKTKKNSYKKLNEFTTDVQNVIHCQSLLQTNEEILQALLKTECDKEVDELQDCVDCYRQYNERSDKNWFCKPCSPPHELVFAKIPSFPYWPAKVIKTIPESNQHCVRFFGGEHEYGVISIENIKPIHSTLQQLKITKPSPPLAAALKELKQYQKSCPTDQNGHQSVGGNNATPVSTPVRAKRSRKRADGSRARKKVHQPIKIKTERNELNDEMTADSSPQIDSTPKQPLTSTPMPFVKSPIRTRNRGLKTPFQTKPTTPEVKSSPSPQRSRRSSRTTKKSVGRPTKTPAKRTANVIQSPSLPSSSKTSPVNRRNKRAINGYEEVAPNSSKRLRTDDDEENSSLARSRPVRQIKPNTRFQSPEVEVKLPRRQATRTRGLSAQKTIIKSEPKADPSNHNNVGFHRPFEPTSLNFVADDQEKSQTKSNRITAKRTQTGGTVVQPVLQSPQPLPNGPIISPKNSSNATPKASPKRGRPKGVKNKSTIEKMRLQALQTSQMMVSPPRNTPSLPKDASNMSPKFRAQLEAHIKQMDAKHKEEVKKLKSEIECIKQINYRLQNDLLIAKNASANKNEVEDMQKRHSEEIAEIKKKQWCAVCQNESIYYCCWNTSYCSTDCQQQHWHIGHKKTCRRVTKR